MRTIISASVRLAQSFDLGAALPAFLSLSLEDTQMILVGARLAVGRHEIGKRSASVPHSSPKNFPDGGHQCRSLLPSHRVASTGRMKTRCVESFAGVDVPDPGYFLLVEQKCLQLLAAASDHLPESIWLDSALQQIDPDGLQFGYFRGTCNFVCSEQAESPVVPVLNLRRVRKQDAGVGVRRNLGGPAEIEDPGRIQLENQVFPPTADFPDCPALESGRKVGRNGPAKGETGQMHLGYALSEDCCPQHTSDGFDFRHFWHRNYSQAGAGGRTSMNEETEKMAFPIPGSP
jgi:hypothetical protein